MNAQKKSLKITFRVHASSHKLTTKSAMKTKETKKEKNNTHLKMLLTEGVYRMHVEK